MNQPDTLGVMIRQARLEKRFTQEELSERLDTSRTTVQYLESNLRNCSLTLLERLHRVLAPDEPLSLWALASLGRSVSKRSSDYLSEETKATALKDIAKALDFVTPRPSIPTSRSLTTFPRGFEPMTIVVGDRREEPPVTRGDLLAGSASTEDVRHILSLGFADPRSVIRTDKLMVNTVNEEDLRRVFGSTNLLVVGSPFVNFVSRFVNQSSAFRFGPAKVLRTWHQSLNDLKGVDGVELEAFATLSQGTGIDAKTVKEQHLTHDRLSDLERLTDRLRNDSEEQSLREAYRPNVLLDPVARTSYPAAKGFSVSYGLISLTLNPFADSRKYVALMVAGVHLPGTVQALKALAEANFEDRPFGGVIEVVHPSGQTEDSWWSWKTPRYSAKDFVATLEDAASPDRRGKHPAFKEWTREEIDNCLPIYQELLEAVRTD